MIQGSEATLSQKKFSIYKIADTLNMYLNFYDSARKDLDKILVEAVVPIF